MGTSAQPEPAEDGVGVDPAATTKAPAATVVEEVAGWSADRPTKRGRPTSASLPRAGTSPRAGLLTPTIEPPQSARDRTLCAASIPQRARARGVDQTNFLPHRWLACSFPRCHAAAQGLIPQRPRWPQASAARLRPLGDSGLRGQTVAEDRQVVLQPAMLLHHDASSSARLGHGWCSTSCCLQR